jgi:hypothetical protein
MKHLKKFITLSLLSALFTAQTHTLAADDCAVYTSGCGYTRCRECPSLTPAIALGAVALVAIIAVAVQNTKHKHSHCHSL